MKRSLQRLRLLVLLVLPVLGGLLLSAPAGAQEAPALVETTAAEASTTDSLRFSPATVAAAVDDERPPRRASSTDPSVQAQRRRTRRVRLRRAGIALVVITGIAAAVVGVDKLTPEHRSHEDRDGGSDPAWIDLFTGG